LKRICVSAEHTQKLSASRAADTGGGAGALRFAWPTPERQLTTGVTFGPTSRRKDFIPGGARTKVISRRRAIALCWRRILDLSLIDETIEGSRDAPEDAVFVDRNRSDFGKRWTRNVLVRQPGLMTLPW